MLMKTGFRIIPVISCKTIEAGCQKWHVFGMCYSLFQDKVYWELGNFICVSISKYGSDTPVTRPETDKAGLSSRDRSQSIKKKMFK